MGVRAKFQVVELKKSVYGGSSEEPQESVILSAAGGEENKQWSRWTPSGRIEMQITNAPALKQFEIGKHYFVDFTPIDEPKKD